MIQSITAITLFLASIILLTRIHNKRKRNSREYLNDIKPTPYAETRNERRSKKNTKRNKVRPVQTRRTKNGYWY